mmetsp:Transcript_4482/g.17640  ORF Transcript_4482/g.17640 Transcript_4482/m.17640 type:complete len:249 (+) Transcript_4482:282-1028(+)
MSRVLSFLHGAFLKMTQKSKQEAQSFTLSRIPRCREGETFHDRPWRAGHETCCVYPGGFFPFPVPSSRLRQVSQKRRRQRKRKRMWKQNQALAWRRTSSPHPGPCAALPGPCTVPPLKSLASTSASSACGSAGAASRSGPATSCVGRTVPSAREAPPEPVPPNQSARRPCSCLVCLSVRALPKAPRSSSQALPLSHRRGRSSRRLPCDQRPILRCLGMIRRLLSRGDWPWDWPWDWRSVAAALAWSAA